MVHSLANMLLRGIGGSTNPVRQTVPALIQQVMRFSTAPGDPDTHKDFQPTSKTADSNAIVKDIVEQDLKDNPVMIYMKGHPDAPRCGFSALAVRVLKEYGVPFSSRNILEDQELKDSVKAFSHWPTFPQIFIKGEFIGGSDIILNMHQTGELKEKLTNIEATTPHGTDQ